MSETATPYLGIPYQPHSATSLAAAQSMQERAPSDRQRVLDYLTRCGAHGSTDDEGWLALGMDSYRPRRIDLTHAHLVVKTQQTRPTRYGRAASVWVAAKVLQEVKP